MNTPARPGARGRVAFHGNGAGVRRDRRAFYAGKRACRLARQSGTMEKNSKRPETERDTVRKTRRCLVCAQPFQSEWAGERVCRKCKSTAAWRTN